MPPWDARAVPPWTCGLHRRHQDRRGIAPRPRSSARPCASGECPPAPHLSGDGRSFRCLAAGAADAEGRCPRTRTSSSAAPAAMAPSPPHRPGEDARRRTPSPSPADRPSRCRIAAGPRAPAARCCSPGPPWAPRERSPAAHPHSRRFDLARPTTSASLAGDDARQSPHVEAVSLFG